MAATAQHQARSPQIKIEVDHAGGRPLGLELTIDPANGEVLVASVLEGARGEVAGLLRGHQLLTVNGVSVTGLTLAAIGKMVARNASCMFACHSFDNPSLWAKMLSHGVRCEYKTRADRKYKPMFMWADCHAGTLCWGEAGKNTPIKQRHTLKATDISEISATPPDGPEHDAHQKRMDMLHHIKTHAAAYSRHNKDDRALWVATQKAAHRATKQADKLGCIELACYHDGFLIYDHTKDLRIAGGTAARNEWLDAIDWYHRVCRKHQMDVVIKRFKQIDRDHSGDIDITELKALLPGVRGAKAAEALFRKHDVNNDGKLTFDEFIPLLAELEGRSIAAHSPKAVAAAAVRAGTRV